MTTIQRFSGTRCWVVISLRSSFLPVGASLVIILHLSKVNQQMQNELSSISRCLWWVRRRIESTFLSLLILIRPRQMSRRTERSRGGRTEIDKTDIARHSIPRFAGLSRLCQCARVASENFLRELLRSECQSVSYMSNMSFCHCQSNCFLRDTV